MIYQMYGLQIEEVNLFDKEEVKKVGEFLKDFELNYEQDIDYTLVAKNGEEIVGTCSKAKNILKCFAIAPKLRGEGLTATLITSLINKLFEQGIYHSFIFTKPSNKDIFTSLNYKVLYEAEEAILLESGIYDINSYLDKLIKKENIDVNTSKAALVMNCNPFTEGHKYLIEKASETSEEVLVFMVEEDKSLFPFNTRYQLVKEGVKHLSNVKVIRGGEYIISSATFPSYFLRKEDERLRAYTKIDAGIFGKYFCSKLNIKKRLVGEEPYCNVTNAYNEALKKELIKYGVELIIIERKIKDELAISASRVRNLIKEGSLDKIKLLVPKVTWDFLNTPEGKEIVEKIKQSNSPH